MNIFPDNEFLAWFFSYFTGDSVCPHCEAAVYEDEITESGEDFVVCPHCGANITEGNLAAEVEEEEKKEKNDYRKYEKMKKPLKRNIAIADVLTKDLVIINIQAKDKEDVLSKITNLFFDKGKIKNKEQMYVNLLKREEMGSTGVGKGLAIPYAVSDANEDLVTAILISKEGIEFNSSDGNPTHVFVSITGRSPSQRDIGPYLKYLAHICRVFNNSDIVPKLKEAKTVDDVFDIIKRFEDGLEKYV